MEIKDFVFTIINVALPIILGYLVWLLKEERNERKATALGMKEILGYMIDRYYSEVMLQGYLTTDQRNVIEGVYKAYAANKGNGAREAKWNEIKKIKIDDTKPNTSIYYTMIKEKVKEDRELEHLLKKENSEYSFKKGE